MLRVTTKEIEDALRKALGSFRLDHVELREGFDHDGDAAVFVTAFLEPDDRLMPGEISAAASVAVGRTLERVGDERLSYLYLRRPNDERPIDENATLSPS
jgi:hypothetical protein